MSSERPKLISLLVTGLGSSWSCKIQHNYVAFNQYWLTTEKILEVVDRKPSFNIQSIAELKIRPIINSLKNPTAKDINGMDSKLLKSLRELLAYPLTQTYKPVSTTGDIPNNLEDSNCYSYIQVRRPPEHDFIFSVYLNDLKEFQNGRSIHICMNLLYI